MWLNRAGEAKLAHVQCSQRHQQHNKDTTTSTTSATTATNKNATTNHNGNTERYLALRNAVEAKLGRKLDASEKAKLQKELLSRRMGKSHVPSSADKL